MLGRGAAGEGGCQGGQGAYREELNASVGFRPSGGGFRLEDKRESGMMGAGEWDSVCRTLELGQSKESSVECCLEGGV